MSTKQKKYQAKLDKQNSVVSSEDTLSEGGFTQDQGCQTEVIQRDYVPMNILQQFNLESEAYPHFLYRSHTLTGLFAVGILIFVGSRYYTVENGISSLLQNGHTGMYFTAFAFIIYGLIYFPNTIMQRPHPAFWRIVHSIGIFWMLMITFVNFYSKDDLQKFLAIAVDPELGKPIPSKTFAADCRFYTPDHPESNFYNIVNAVDIFFLAHVCGWMFKMIITRDIKLCMLQSIIFEILEITFRHWLPNFWECWWDHVILDLILCNTGGMLIGLALIKIFNMKKYRWSLRTSEKKTYFQNLKSLFSGINLDEHHWKMFSSTKRFLSVCSFLFIFQLIDLSFFFNKFVLHITEHHNLCAIRTFMIGFLSIPAAREYYEFISNEYCKRLGPYCWNLIGILTVETMLFFKNYDPEQFSAPFPWYVKLIWGVIGGTFLFILTVLMFNDVRKKIREIKENKNAKKSKKQK